MDGQQLKQFLDHNKVVKRQLAISMGMCRQSLNQCFARANVSTDTLEAIAEAMNTTPENIYAEMRELGIFDK